MDAVASYVRRFSLDKILSGDLLQLLTPVQRGPGELIIRADDQVRELLFLVEGRAKAYITMESGESHLASFFKPFEVFGEVEIFAFERYNLSVEALTETVCLSVPATAIKKAAERNWRLFMFLCGRLGAKLEARNIAGSINVRYPVVNRLASYLLAAGDGKGLVLGTDDLGEIANFLGTSYRQLARVVRRFRDQGILAKTRGRIRVLNKAKLTGFARDRYD